MTEQVHSEPGAAIFRHEHGEDEAAFSHEVSVSWGRDYPAVQPPKCDDCGAEYERVSGDDHTANLRDPLTEDELIEREAQERYAAEVALEKAAARERAVQARIEELRAADKGSS